VDPVSSRLVQQSPHKGEVAVISSGRHDPPICGRLSAPEAAVTAGENIEFPQAYKLGDVFDIQHVRDCTRARDGPETNASQSLITCVLPTRRLFGILRHCQTDLSDEEPLLYQEDHQEPDNHP
jgi:hypothetical protein